MDNVNKIQQDLRDRKITYSQYFKRLSKRLKKFQKPDFQHSNN